MKIYDFPYVPNSRKVRLFLSEKGIKIDFEVIDIRKGEQKKIIF